MAHLTEMFRQRKRSVPFTLLPTIYEDIIDEVEELAQFKLSNVWAENGMTREWCHVPTWWEEVFSFHLTFFQESISHDVSLPYATAEETKELKHFLCFYPSVFDTVLDPDWPLDSETFTLKPLQTVPTEPWVLPAIFGKPELQEQGLPALEFCAIIWREVMRLYVVPEQYVRMSAKMPVIDFITQRLRALRQRVLDIAAGPIVRRRRG